jgi:hypothetical protein
MRHSSSIMSLSWIPSEAIEGSMRLAFDAGFTHYDPPPPDVIEDLEALRLSDRFRFANVLSAWIDVDGDHGDHRLRLRRRRLDGEHDREGRAAVRTFEAIALPDLQQEPERGDGWVGLCRPREGGRACRRRVACAGVRSCSGRRRWFGQRSR